MGVPTDANLSYGIIFEEGFEFPMICFEPEDPWSPEVEMINYCSDSFEMFIMAIPESVKSASRGYPEDNIDPYVFSSINYGEWNEQLLNFCDKYKIELTKDQVPQWFLSSYWGQ